ncbi:MAG: hypothetical protein ACLPX8_05260 [Bryobacteraceae bacterium]|jgi:hypothetical protein
MVSFWQSGATARFNSAAASNPHPLVFIERGVVAAPVVKLRGAGVRQQVCDFLLQGQRKPVFSVSYKRPHLESREPALDITLH